MHHVLITYYTLKTFILQELHLSVMLMQSSCPIFVSRWALYVYVGGGSGEAVPTSDVNFDKYLFCLS